MSYQPRKNITRMAIKTHGPNVKPKRTQRIIRSPSGSHSIDGTSRSGANVLLEWYGGVVGANSEPAGL